MKNGQIQINPEVFLFVGENDYLCDVELFFVLVWKRNTNYRRSAGSE